MDALDTTNPGRRFGRSPITLPRREIIDFDEPLGMFQSLFERGLP